VTIAIFQIFDTKLIGFQIARLYRPLEDEMYSDTEDDDPLRGTQLLPTHTRRGLKAPPKSADSLSDVWDEREELFGIGDDEDDDDLESRGAGAPPRTPVPKITITQP
jgi:hypothetical protein